MPYYRCTRCALLSYSAASPSTVGRCPHCEAPAAAAMNVENESASRRFEPVAAKAARRQTVG
jgi:NMD protein affecting ribosome stability and mRNA decay